MKTFTAAAFLFLFACAQAFAQANVTFAAPSRYKITVIINARTQTADQYVRLEGLPGGDQTAQVTLTGGGETYHLQTTVTLPDDMETSYFVLVVNKTVQIHWANETRLNKQATAANTQPSRSNGQFLPDQSEGNSFEYRGERDRNSQPENTYGQDQNNYGRGYGEGYGSQDRQYQHGRYQQGGICDCQNQNPVITPLELARLRTTLRQIAFDDDKLTVIGNTVRHANLMADDVRLLMTAMSFDSNRLKLAKRAFARTCDQQNYHTVSSAFDYQSSARELQQYIRNRALRNPEPNLWSGGN